MQEARYPFPICFAVSPVLDNVRVASTLETISNWYVVITFLLLSGQALVPLMLVHLARLIGKRSDCIIKMLMKYIMSIPCNWAENQASEKNHVHLVRSALRLVRNRGNASQLGLDEWHGETLLEPV